MSTEAKPLVVSLVSEMRGCGKSTLATNLARAFTDTGQRVLIREVKDDSPERLRRWQALGLTPGAVVYFVSHEPLDDLFEVQVGDQIVPMGSEGLAGLLGELLPEKS